MSIEFLLTSLIVILLPGTGVLYTIASALGGGFKNGVIAAFGCTLGILPAAAASLVGLAALLHVSALTYQVFKFIGVAYLLYMAYEMLRAGGPLEFKTNQDRSALASTALRGMLINVLNPKLSLFFLAFLPQFVDANEANATRNLISHAAVFMLMTFIVFVGYAGCAARARDYVISRPVIVTWLQRSFAACFAMLGIRLALSNNG